MPADRAPLIGLMNAVASTTVVAMPGELAVTASWMAESMVDTVGWVDSAPVQAGVGRPRMAAQSAKPYWVGVKNELSVTWLTKVNFHFGVEGKVPPAACAAEEVFFSAALLPDEVVQAAISAEAGGGALKPPPPPT